MDSEYSTTKQSIMSVVGNLRHQNRRENCPSVSVCSQNKGKIFNDPPRLPRSNKPSTDRVASNRNNKRRNNYNNRSPNQIRQDRPIPPPSFSNYNSYSNYEVTPTCSAGDPPASRSDNFYSVIPFIIVFFFIVFKFFM
ncbi:hypothetical protein A4A49_15042 [Nicotiana attenuata]|uniref:Uncharacterized protein n=1 Tax=Nicotiana attenuata TaxID=49451 RepID=A0A314KK77_NICAT|nr:hypothetical protein A4A49_15042 [Nicotiana attenuata]